jgi:hypothetical protein
MTLTFTFEEIKKKFCCKYCLVSQSVYNFQRYKFLLHHAPKKSCKIRYKEFCTPPSPLKTCNWRKLRGYDVIFCVKLGLGFGLQPASCVTGMLYSKLKESLNSSKSNPQCARYFVSWHISVLIYDNRTEKYLIVYEGKLMFSVSENMIQYTCCFYLYQSSMICHQCYTKQRQFVLSASSNKTPGISKVCTAELWVNLLSVLNH